MGYNEAQTMQRSVGGEEDSDGGEVASQCDGGSPSSASSVWSPADHSVLCVGKWFLLVIDGLSAPLRVPVTQNQFLRILVSAHFLPGLSHSRHTDL